MCEDGGRAPVRSLSKCAVREREEDAPRTALEERRLDGTRYFRVIALGVARACALFAAPASVRPAVLIHKRARTQKAGGKSRRGVQGLGGARARYGTARGAGRGGRCERDADVENASH
jgi:hypothetical protein